MLDVKGSKDLLIMVLNFLTGFLRSGSLINRTKQFFSTFHATNEKPLFALLTLPLCFYAIPKYTYFSSINQKNMKKLQIIVVEHLMLCGR
jgi:hypothetical protein